MATATSEFGFNSGFLFSDFQSEPPHVGCYFTGIRAHPRSSVVKTICSPLPACGPKWRHEIPPVQPPRFYPCHSHRLGRCKESVIIFIFCQVILLAAAAAFCILPAQFMEPQGDIALIGLAVMGQNLILNMNDHGFVVVAYNRTTEKVDHFLANEAKRTKVLGAHSIAEMVSKLKKPRRVMMLVKAGKPVDDFIDQLIPDLEPGDIIIDGGNSLFEDTNRRQKYVESKGLLYIGTGVSGGEEGARRGPSIMPGGSPAAWPHVKNIFQAVSAKVEGNVPCCDWVGEAGAGHYVKMVHNGIE
jgi:hypothetical protein